MVVLNCESNVEIRINKEQIFVICEMQTSFFYFSSTMQLIKAIVFLLFFLGTHLLIAQQRPGNVSPEVGVVMERAADCMSRSAYDSAGIIINEAFSQTEFSHSEIDLYYLLCYEAENMYYTALFDQGLASALRGLELAQALSNDTLIGNAENLVGLFYMSLDKYDLALEHFRNAIRRIRPHSLDFLSYRYQVLANAAECFLKLQLPDSAFQYARLGLAETRSLNRLRGEAIIEWTMAEAWIQKEQYDSAQFAVNRALALVENSQHRDLVLTLYSTNMRLFAAMGNAESLFLWMDKGLTEIENPLNTDYARSEFLEAATDFCLQFNALEKGSELMRSWKLLQKNLVDKQQTQRLNTLKDYYEKNQRLVVAKEHDEAQRKQIELRNTIAVILGILSVVLIILVIIALVYSRQRQRISKLEHKEQLRKNEIEYEIRALENRMSAVSDERNRIASDLHDDIGASLSSIRIYSGAAHKRFNDDPQESLRLIERINESSSGMMDRMSDIVWSINPKNDNVESIIFRMKSQAAEVLSPLDIEVEYSIDKDSENIQPSITARRNIYLIFKEAINNIAKYSEAKHVKVGFFVSGTTLSLVVHDDGKGFEVAAARAGNGMGSMKQRAEMLGGTLLVESAPGKGTELRAEFQIARISDTFKR